MKRGSILVGAVVLITAAPTLLFAQMGGAPSAPAAGPASAPAAVAQPAAAPAAKPYYSSVSTFGELNANPAAKALVDKDLVGLPAPPDGMEEMVNGLTPRDVQQYVPDIVTDAALKKLDDDLAKVPAPKAAEPAKPAAPAAPAASATPSAPATPAKPAQ